VFFSFISVKSHYLIEITIQDVAYSNVLRYKFRTIQKMMEENLQKIKVAKDEAELDHHLTIHEQLKSAELELAQTLGIVVAK
jgi:DNA primase